jgi:hypothetical protein
MNGLGYSDANLVRAMGYGLQDRFDETLPGWGQPV